MSAKFFGSYSTLVYYGGNANSSSGHIKPLPSLPMKKLLGELLPPVVLPPWALNMAFVNILNNNYVHITASKEAPAW